MRFNWEYGRYAAIRTIIITIILISFLGMYMSSLTQTYFEIDNKMKKQRLVDIYNDMLERAKIRIAKEEKYTLPINDEKIINLNKVSSKETLNDKLAFAAVDPFTALAWALGFIVQQPKTFHLTNFDMEIYTVLDANDIEKIKAKYPNTKLKAGNILYINPETFCGLFDGKGLLLRLIADRKWVCHASIPVTRNTEVKTGKVKIYKGEEPLEENQIKDSNIVFEQEFYSNDFSFILPKAMNSMAYSCSMYIVKPTKADGFGYFRYYSKTGEEYAAELAESDKAMSAMTYGKQLDQENEKCTPYRTEELILQGREESRSSASPFIVPKNIVVVDKYGEVYRGPLANTLNLKIAPGKFMIGRMKGEIELATNPPTKTGWFEAHQGRQNVIVVYPWVEKEYVEAESKYTQTFDGEVQVIAPYGTVGKMEMYIDDERKPAASIETRVETFCLDTIYAKSDQPVEKIKFVLYISGKRFEKMWYAGTPQQVPFYLISDSFYARTFANHGAAPIVGGGFVNIGSLRNWLTQNGRNIYYKVASQCLGLKSKFIQRSYNDLAKANNMTYVILGPERRVINDNGAQMVAINKILGLSDSTYRPLRNGYKIGTREYYRVAVPKNRVGLILGVDMNCGNIYLVYIAPGEYRPPQPGYFYPSKLPEVPELQLPKFDIYIGKSAANVKNETIVPSTVAPLVGTPSIKIDVKQSQLQWQGQNQVSTNVNNNNNTNINNNNNINENTNINANNVDVNNNNVNQNSYNRNVRNNLIVVNFRRKKRNGLDQIAA